jgi:hypothetical protein
MADGIHYNAEDDLPQGVAKRTRSHDPRVQRCIPVIVILNRSVYRTK